MDSELIGTSCIQRGLAYIIRLQEVLYSRQNFTLGFDACAHLTADVGEGGLLLTRFMTASWSRKLKDHEGQWATTIVT